MNGWKTYIGAAGFGLLALYYLLDGDHVKAGEMLLAAVGLLGLRHAIQKAAGGK